MDIQFFEIQFFEKNNEQPWQNNETLWKTKKKLCNGMLLVVTFLGHPNRMIAEVPKTVQARKKS